jgi:hypothetical protein
MPFSSDMVKNSIRGISSFWLSRAAFCRCGTPKKAGDDWRPGCGAPARQPAGRFIWQLVGVLEMYGSICLIGTKV